MIFLFCEPGDAVANQFDEFTDEFTQCKWYTFPVEMQRMCVIVLANAQQPTAVQGFGNLECTRQSMKRVKFTFYTFIYLVHGISV